MSPGHPDSIEAFTGDRAAAVHLRQALRAISDERAGSELAARIDAVLAGRLDFRDLAVDEEFSALTREGARRFEEYWASLDAEQRRQLAQHGEQTLADTERALDDPRS
jgi:hypothetical protein